MHYPGPGDRAPPPPPQPGWRKSWPRKGHLGIGPRGCPHALSGDADVLRTRASHASVTARVRDVADDRRRPFASFGAARGTLSQARFKPSRRGDRVRVCTYVCTTEYVSYGALRDAATRCRRRAAGGRTARPGPEGEERESEFESSPPILRFYIQFYQRTLIPQPQFNSLTF